MAYQDYGLMQKEMSGVSKLLSDLEHSYVKRVKANPGEVRSPTELPPLFEYFDREWFVALHSYTHTMAVTYIRNLMTVELYEDYCAG